jgi:hypothetical protein
MIESSHHQFTDQEMALILKRAAELQERADGRGATRSLGEITEIAAEVGIDRAFVDAAIAELRQPTVRTGWLGAPTRFHAECTIPGALSPDAIGVLLDRVRAELGLHGEVHQVFDGVEWRARAALGVTLVTIGPRGSNTRIAMTAERADQAGLVVAGALGIGGLCALGGVAIAMNVTDSALAASAIVAASGLFGALASMRAMWRGVATHWRERTRALVAMLAESVPRLHPNDEVSADRGLPG